MSPDAVGSLQELAMARVRRRLLRYPDDQRAIDLGAVALARDGRTDEALEWAARAEALDPQDAVALYNLACVCGDAESGLRYLESAITHGYPHLSWIENDADLAALRADPRFEGVVAPLRAAADRYETVTGINPGKVQVRRRPRRHGLRPQGTRARRFAASRLMPAGTPAHPVGRACASRLGAGTLTVSLEQLKDGTDAGTWS